jgi:lysophospholipase L1-like esterase
MTRWLVALLFLSSCTGMSTPDTPSHPTPATSTMGSSAPSNGRYFAIGDSYTIGESVTPAERFPHQLARELDLPEPLIIAKTGWTTDELSNALDTIRVAGPYDLVTLLIGVNNQYRGRDAEQYRGEFAELLRRAIGFAGDNPKKVIVVSIPDWGVTPFAEGRDRAKIASEIDRYNAINREEAAKAGARYVDITPVSRRNDTTLVAGDGLHPSGKQYTEWVKLILPEAREALR